jgi:hypothetical protein
LPEGTPIKGMEGGDATLGFFKDEKGTIYCLLVNMDYKNSKDFKIFTDRKLTIFNIKTKKWNKVSFKGRKGAEYFELILPAGGGVLLKF